MENIIPAALNQGDTIAVVSPSDPITSETKEYLHKGIEFLVRKGFKVELAPNALSNTLGYCATAQEKADDINQMFEASQVKAIICSQGGQNANSVLPYLNYRAIKSNPKIFLGISNISVLLNTVYSKTGLITFHGNDIMWGFGRDFTTYDEREFLTRIVDGKIGRIEKNKEWLCVREGSVQGRLIGGNLECLTDLAGTEYFPNVEGAILFLEYFGEESAPTHLSKSFHQIKQLGVFEKIKGLWLGYYKCKSDVTIEQVAAEVLQEYNFPILQCNDFGHNTPNTVIPIGAQARLDAANCTVEIISPCVA
jgi:muramoyltetrapeptide carboxypeptidase